jgi:hypothetical protein
MTLPERIGAVVLVNGAPMTSAQIAAKMRRPLKSITGHISRAHSYGYLKVSRVDVRNRRYWWDAGEKARTV